MGDCVHGVKYHEVKNTVVKYNVSLLIRPDLLHSISAQGSYRQLSPSHMPTHNH